MIAAAMFLTCAVVAPAAAGTTIVHNIRLPDDVAAQMATDATPIPTVRFTDAPTAEHGWVLTYAVKQDDPVIGVSRISRAADRTRLFAVRSGQAIRTDAARLYSFKETTRGTCRLAHEGELT